MKRIASVAVMCGDHLLIGRRSDDQRWNLPGGHCDGDESPEEGAARELHEETGIAVKASKLLQLRDPQEVKTFTGKTIEVYSYLLLLPHQVEVTREGTDPGEAHDWYWTNVSAGLPPDIAQNWHNKTDATMEAIGLHVCTNDSFNKSEELFDLEKAWPKHYNRVKGQTKDKGVASKKQYRYMQAMAAQGDSDAKAYLANSPKGGKSLPEDGEGRQSDKAKKVATPSVVALGSDVARMKAKYSSKKPKTFNQQVVDVKARYKVQPLEKSSDLFYAKIEGLLQKSNRDDHLVGSMMDAEVHLRESGDTVNLEKFYKSAERLFDARMSREEQVVHELSYMARQGCEESHESLVEFVSEMYGELVKYTPIENSISAMVKAKYNELNKTEDAFPELPKKCTSCKQGVPKLKEKKKDMGMHFTWWDCPKCETTGAAVHQHELDSLGKSEDNSRVKGKVNGESYRIVHGYKRYTSGAKRGQYVHRDEAEKRLGRKLKTTEHVDHQGGNRSDNKNTKVMSASEHSAKTNKTRAGKGYSGPKRYAHTRDE